VNEENELLKSILHTAQQVPSFDEEQEYDLDFSEESIGRLDELIDDFWGEGGPSKDNFDTMVWVFGCYIAAVVENNFKGHWYKEESGEVNFEPEISEIAFNPFNWVAKKFELKDSLEAKYEFVTNMMKVDRKGQ
jgi:hypothetical protein